MSIIRMLELSAQSTVSFEDAMQKCITSMAKDGYIVNAAWVKDQKITVTAGKISEYRVHLKVSCTVPDTK